MPTPDLGILLALDALLQEGSVTGAARRVGLSTPAMSHTLARLRELLGDPLLVRAGRAMVLTPRAETLRPRIRDLCAAAAQALAPEAPFSPRELERAFVVHATDHVLTVLGPALDRLAREAAPRLTLRFAPNSPDDPEALREGDADLAIGIYGELPPELRTRILFTDRFVCVVRKDHPTIGKRLTLERFLALEHVQIAPRGRPGGYVDDLLAERGLARRVARAVPYTLAALLLVARTDDVLTVSERIARALAPAFGLRLLEPPLPLRPYALSLLWHPRFDGDPAHRFLRDLLVRAAEASAAETHEGARTRLDATDPTGRPPSRGRPRRRA